MGAAGRLVAADQPAHLARERPAEAHFRSAGPGEAHVPSELAELFPRVVYGASPRNAGPGLHFQPRTREGDSKVARLATSRRSQRSCEESLDTSAIRRSTTRSEKRRRSEKKEEDSLEGPAGGAVKTEAGSGEWDPSTRRRRRPRWSGSACGSRARRAQHLISVRLDEL
jgi:hypothetical protein